MGEDRERRVAQMLGFNPDRPDTWPRGIIRDILAKADRAAELIIVKECDYLKGLT